MGEVHLSFARHRPETYRLFRDLETTPSRPMLQACLYILRPSISKFSMAVLAISFSDAIQTACAKKLDRSQLESVQCARTSQSITQYTRITTSKVMPHANATRSPVCPRPISLRWSLTAIARHVAMDPHLPLSQSPSCGSLPTYRIFRPFLRPHAGSTSIIL